MAELSKREKVYHVFQQISQTYDRANGRISLGMESRWKDCLIEAVCEQAAKGSRVLDVCSGTGDIAISLAAHRPDLKVTGLDFSPAMLDVARKKGAPLANVTWQEGDAMNLPFEDNTFSAACISFGLRNTSDYLRVLQEMTKYGLTPEEWGGDTIVAKVAAKTRMGLDELLEMVALQAEIMELKANPDKIGRAHV